MPDFSAAFQHHRALASRSDGFVSLRCLRPQLSGHENEMLLLLEFQTEANLRLWRASPDHGLVAERYRRLWTRDPETELFNAEE